MKEINSQITANHAKNVANAVNDSAPILQLNFILAQICELSGNGKFEFYCYETLFDSVIDELISRGFVVSSEYELLGECYTIISW